MNWLGVDEFGRPHLSTLAEAVAFSLLRAGYTTIALIVLATVLALLVEIQPRRFSSVLIRPMIDALESVPIFVWVIAAVGALPHHGTVVAPLVFIVAGLPLAFNTLAGIVREIVSQPYYLAGIALGASSWHLVRWHILPNLIPHCLPLLLHICGAAIAVYGAVGIFGFVNRQSLDLGVILLRGKEQASFDPTLLLLAIAAYASIFLGLRLLIYIVLKMRSG